jgi:hypothetical protein
MNVFDVSHIQALSKLNVANASVSSGISVCPSVTTPESLIQFDTGEFYDSVNTFQFYY